MPTVALETGSGKRTPWTINKGKPDWLMGTPSILIREEGGGGAGASLLGSASSHPSGLCWKCTRPVSPCFDPVLPASIHSPPTSCWMNMATCEFQTWASPVTSLRRNPTPVCEYLLPPPSPVCNHGNHVVLLSPFQAGICAQWLCVSAGRLTPVFSSQGNSWVHGTRGPAEGDSL